MTEVEDKYTRETITSLKVWVPGKLFSFTCTRPTGFRFTAGQFARLGVDNTLKLPGEPDIIWRAYSMVSGPFDEHLEFFSIVVPDGAFTSHLSQLKVGSTLYIDKTNFGFLTTARFESGKDLWLLGSGTGLAPFLSILHDPQTWEQFENIVLVHSARTAEELVYQEMIGGFTEHPVLSEMIEDVKKIKEAIYNPDQGLYARLRDLEQWQASVSRVIWTVGLAVTGLVINSIYLGIFQ